MDMKSANLARRLALLLCACAPVLLTSQPAVASGTSEYAKTRYPIILVHGFSGAKKWFGITDYWYGMPEDLERYGAKVYVADLSPFNDEDVRGLELVNYINTVKALTGSDKVNLVGHSQGGLSVRFAAAAIPESVASVTTIGTPHTGVPGMNVISTAGGAAFTALLDFFVGGPHPTDPSATAYQISPAGVAAFNARIPSAGLPENCSTHADRDVRDGNVQRLYSWTGRSVITTVIDPLDGALAALSVLTSLGGGGESDGGIPVCGAKFGKVIGVYNWNHGDEINQLFGLVPFGANPVTVLRTHANRLKQDGL
jgi:triacylglycerol lipase